MFLGYPVGGSSKVLTTMALEGKLLPTVFSADIVMKYIEAGSKPSIRANVVDTVSSPFLP